mmetsp:Transcript_3761/g.9961  ORF Transcript_3761/g.9961 Transcript_3761/m.9961 type:complete len:118 (+) Transcript_3761:330-683(+)
MSGVKRCIVGYSGGNEANPTYFDMKDHTESLLIEYDAKSMSYERILDKWMQLVGTPYQTKTQYRTAAFVLNAQQETIAKAAVRNWSPDFVDVELAARFYMAEARHQDFLSRNSKGRR